MAYLYNAFDIGRWLVRNYPYLAMQPYYHKFEESNPLMKTVRSPTEAAMPYTGENILHMTIVKRNLAETRWILDFYRDRKHSVYQGLETILLANATGRFFRRDGSFYFGGYPLHFAACTNETSMFDLVLSYASTIIHDKHAKMKEEYSMLGPNAIFMRDVYGSTVLHLCVYHNLLDMYQHLITEAERLVKKDLQNLYSDFYEVYQQNDKRLDTADPYITLKPLFYVGDHPKPAESRSKIFLFPSNRKSNGELEPLPTSDWIETETKKIILDRLVLALNQDFLSPLTQAALGNGSRGNDEAEQLKKRTLEFLVKNIKAIKVRYGPLTTSVIELEGLEVPFNANNYNNPAQVRKNARTALDIICSLDSDICISITEIVDIINAKWTRYGYPAFYQNSIITLLLIVAITIIICLAAHTPAVASQWSSPAIVTVTFMYPIAIVLLIILNGKDVLYVYKYGLVDIHCR